MTTTPYWDDDILVIECDTCAEENEYEMGGAFQNAINAAKADGWRIRPDANTSQGWRHTCGECITKQNEARIFRDAQSKPRWTPGRKRE